MQNLNHIESVYVSKQQRKIALAKVQKTRKRAIELLSEYLNPRRDVDCDREIVEIVDTIIEAASAKADFEKNKKRS